MNSQRLYKCLQCGLIYWGHELVSNERALPPSLIVNCPTPDCTGRTFVGQATPDEAGKVHGILTFPVLLILLHWAFKLGWGFAAIIALFSSIVITQYSRRKHRPVTASEDLLFAANEMLRRGEAFHQAGKLEKAKTAYERAESLLTQEVDLKLESAVVGRLANVERELGRFADAQSHYQRALALAEQLDDLSGQINRHNNLGVLFGDDLHDPIQAITHVERALLLVQQFADPARTSQILTHLAKRQREAGQLDQSSDYVEKAVRICQQIRQNQLMAEALHERAYLGMARHDNRQAETDLQEALRVLGKNGDARLRHHITTALKTVQDAIRTGGFVQIIPPGQSPQANSELPFELDPTAQEALRPAMEHMEAGRLSQAITATRQALQTASVRENTTARALANSNLGDMLQTVGNIGEAEQVLRVAISGARAAAVPYLECSALLNLGLVLHTRGAWADGRNCLEQALALTKMGHAMKNQGRVCLALGNIHRDSANYEAAKRLYEQAARFAVEHQDLALEGPVAQSLGNLYFKQRQWTQAEPYYTKALQIARQTRDARLEGIVLNMLGNIKRRQSQPQEALELLRRSLTSLDACPTMTGKAGRLNNLAAIEQELNMLTEAREHYQQSVTIYRQLGLTSPEIAGCIQNLGVLLVRLGEVLSGRDHILEASTMDNIMVAQAFAIANESARLQFLQQAQRRLDDLISLIARGGRLEGDPKTVAACADVVFRRKGASLEAMAIQRDMAASGRYPQLANTLQKLAQIKIQLARMVLDGQAIRSEGSYTSEVADLVEQKQHLERSVSSEIPELALEEQLQRADRHVITSHLPKNSVLIEFVRFGFFSYPPVDRAPALSPDRYVAFVISPTRNSEVQMIDLGDATPIDETLAQFRSQIASSNENTARRGLGEAPNEQIKPRMQNLGEKLRSILFDPLLPSIGSCQQLLIAPDHNLTRLPFEVLPTANGRYLIDDYLISYVSTGRDLLRFGVKNIPSQPSEPLIIADPNFDLCAEMFTCVAELENHAGHHTFDLDRGRIKLDFANRLPGTRREGQAIANLLENAQLWLDDGALEERLKKECKSPLVLHLATHGHFLEDQRQELGNDLRGLDSARLSTDKNTPEPIDPVMNNPLLRSWLILAGFNTWLKKEQRVVGAEDGILTAEDVSGLDLLNTELVVLSACETGLGEVRIGEGVMGLRRAFVLAGAKTLVMSLWKVPDQQTRELMEDFYRRILLSGEPRAESLRNAQLAMKRIHPDVRSWGGFICQGDPAPMPRK